MHLTGLRAWVSLTGASVTCLILAPVILLGITAGKVSIPAFGPVNIPENFPLNILLTVLAGTALALWSHYKPDPRVVQLATRPTRLASARIAWTLTGAVLVIVIATLFPPNPDFPPRAYIANALLFAGLGMILLLVNRPDLLWAPASLWVLVAMVFGFPGGSTDNWYWWAFPMHGQVNATRMAVSVGIWAAAGAALALRPVLADRRT